MSNPIITVYLIEVGENRSITPVLGSYSLEMASELKNDSIMALREIYGDDEAEGKIEALEVEWIEKSLTELFEYNKTNKLFSDEEWKNILKMVN